MSVLASLSKDVMTDAYLSSQYVDRGQTYWDPNLFAKNLGQVVRDQFAGIRLMGEIERREGKETYDALTSSLKKALAEASLWNICQNGSAGWRAVLSLYFVWTGIFSYGEESGHDLWPPVLKGLGLETDGNLSDRCGRMFKQCLKENGLEEFASVQGGHSHVTRILLHGLIPQRHMDRFVDELILPELGHHLGVYTTGEHLVEKWKRHTMFRYLPKPIQRFVEHGHPVTINIAERFLDMAGHWDEDDPSLWRQWGLPQYMVDAFRRHVTDGNRHNLRKSWSGAFTERPFLYFDLQQAEVPLLHIPSQQMKAAADFKLKWADLQGLEREIDLRMNSTSVDGILYSDAEDLDVGPCAAGWCLETTDRAAGMVAKQSISISMPLSNRGEQVPLYVFNRSTGKLLDTGGRRPLPEDLLLVFPKDAVLEISGGRLSSEPERLPGLWKEWQYVLCVLEGDGRFGYLGPDADLTGELSVEIGFSCTGFDESPELTGSGQAPVWLRCLEGWPIINALDGLALRCSETGFSTWRRAFGKLMRRDKAGFVKALDLDFRRVGERYEASIPFPFPCEPGVYELHLRGPLGVDDVVLTFVYLPLEDLDRIPEPETGLVSEFRLRSSAGIDFQPLFSTKISGSDGTILLSLQEDQGEAFCGAKLFAHTRQPVTLLFSRSDLRWSRRSETGLFHWDRWRCRPEAIPVQRLDEIADARVAVQCDGVASIATSKRSNKLKLLLKTLGDKKEEEQTLYSYDAPPFRRNVHDTWIVDLKKFSDLIKSLRSVEAAAVMVQSPDAQGELSLFTVLKHPAFKDFKVKVQGGSDAGERLKISWTPQRNDPRTRRVVRVYPECEPKAGVVQHIEDGALPPFEIPLEASQQPGLWCVKIEAHRSRFGLLGPSSDSTPSFTWFRVPRGWGDWLEWPELRASEEKAAGMEHASQETRQSSFAWTDFLTQFHYDKGEDSFRKIQAILGDEVLESLLPYSRGRIWDIKAASGSKISIEITRSSMRSSELQDLLSHKEPCTWCRIPSAIDLELSLLHSHCDLGKAGSLWRCKKAAEDENACFFSEDGRELDLPVWLEDAVYPDETGSLMARCALEAFWDRPPFLPVLKSVHHNDVFFASEEEERPAPRRSRPTVVGNKGFATLGDLLNSQDRKILTGKYLEACSPEEKAEAERLLEQWRSWAQRTNVNRFLARMVSGRLKELGLNGLSGVAALIARLRARDLWTDRVYGWDADSGKAMDGLYGKTLELVRRATPKALLRDLILSEIIVAWYWNQPLATL